MQLYKSSRISRPDTRVASKKYKIIWRPIIFKPFRIRESTQHKREDKSTSDEEETTENLLDDFIDYLDPKTVDELLKSGNIIVDDKMENFMHSIVEKEEGPRSEEIVEAEHDREFDAQGSEQQGESYRNVTEGKMQIEGGNTSETVASSENIESRDNRKRKDSKKMEIKRKRRNAESKEKYFEALPPFFLRKTSEKIEPNNYLMDSRTQSSKEISDENLLLRIEERKGEEDLSLEKSALSDETLRLPWMERSGRRVQREAVEKIGVENSNVEKVRLKNRTILLFVVFKICITLESLPFQDTTIRIATSGRTFEHKDSDIR